MFSKPLVFVATLVIGNGAFAETIEVKILNKGAEGAMVFEPAYVSA